MRLSFRIWIFCAAPALGWNSSTELKSKPWGIEGSFPFLNFSASWRRHSSMFWSLVASPSILKIQRRICYQYKWKPKAVNESEFYSHVCNTIFKVQVSGHTRRRDGVNEGRRWDYIQRRSEHDGSEAGGIHCDVRIEIDDCCLSDWDRFMSSHYTQLSHDSHQLSSILAWGKKISISEDSDRLILLDDGFCMVPDRTRLYIRRGVTHPATLRAATCHLNLNHVSTSADLLLFWSHY